MFAQNQQNTLPASGNVGVGTTSPSSKLQVNGSMRVDSSLTVKDTAVFEKQARMKDKIVVESDAVILGTLKAKSDLKVQGTAKLESDVKMTALPTTNNNDTTLLFINSNGKVKSGDIGDLLDKIGNSPANKSMLTKMIYSDPCVLSNDQSSLQALTTTSNYYPVWANKVGVLWTGLPCPAQVGIGTDDPQANLDVVGSGHFGNNVGVGTARQTGTSLVVKTDGHQGNGYYAAKFITHFGDNKALAVENATLNKEMFTLYGDGSFQFSNATEQMLRLDADGLLRARKIKVNLDTWPDYVFEKDYSLPTLQATEHYIQQNGHLPNVPSAEEVTKNGLDLGEMNKILLQKVEELTLHLIAQEKRIAELEKQVESNKTSKP